MESPIFLLKALFVELVFLVGINDFQHFFCNYWIKLGAFALFDFCADYILRKVFSVTSVRSHGVIRVCNTDYAGNFRNVVPLKVIRITVTVKAFMVL